MKTIQTRVNNINEEMDDIELQIMKLQKEIEYLQAVMEKLKKKKIKLLKGFNRNL